MSLLAALVISISGLYVPMGPEVFASSIFPSTPSSTSHADIAVADDGRTVLVWAEQKPTLLDQNGVNAYILRPNGQDIAVTQLFAPTTDGILYHNPAVAMAANGRFVVVAEKETVSTGDRDIIGRTFSAEGVAEQPTFTVNAEMPVRNQREPAVAMFANGDFYVVWVEEFSPTDDDIHQAIWFNSSENPFSQFLAPQGLVGTTANERAPRISVDPGLVQLNPAEPSVVVCYTRPNANNMNPEYVAQRINTGGSKISTPVRFLATDPPGGMTSGDVAMDDTGGFVAVWQMDGDGFRQRFDSQGVAQGFGPLDAGPPFASFYEGIRVAAGADGDYTVHFVESSGAYFAEYNADDTTRQFASRPDLVRGMAPARAVIDVSRNGKYAALAWQGTRNNSSFLFFRRFQRIGEGVDSDGDGVSDAFENAAGSNPLDPASMPLLMDLNFDGQVNAADAIFWYRNLIGANPRTIPAEQAP